MRVNEFLAAATAFGTIFAISSARAEPAATLSRSTTYLTAPLADDGLPNYALAILERQRTAVVVDDNAAVPLWKAMGKADLTEPESLAICNEIGLDPDECLAPFDGPWSKPFSKRIAAWLGKRSGDEELAEAVVKELIISPWTDRDFPPAAAWVKQNDARLDLIVLASQKQQLFSPSPEILANPQTAVVNVTLPHVEQLRDAARALLARAMHRAGERDYSRAWEDIAAVWKLGTHAARGCFAVDGMVAAAIRHQAADATMALLSSPDLPLVVAERISQDLAAMPQIDQLTEAVDFGERLSMLDISTRCVTGRLGGLDDRLLDEIGELCLIPVELDRVLQIGNQWCDRIIEVAREQDLAARRAARDRLFDELDELAEELRHEESDPPTVEAASELVGGLLAWENLSGLRPPFLANDRDVVRVMLLRVAAECAIHRLQSGSYPQSLVELKLPEMARLTRDPYSKKPLVYLPREGGYLLYSVFENGADDGGDDCYRTIIDGEWLPNNEEGEVDYAQSDLVLRVPRPPLQLPDARAPH